MPKWVLNAAGTWEYDALGFRASQGNILDASAAPDDRWSLNGNQSAAETVTRWTLGSTDPSNGGPPSQQPIVDMPDGGSPTETAFDLIVDGGTP